jgi:hypothetical protein
MLWNTIQQALATPGNEAYSDQNISTVVFNNIVSGYSTALPDFEKQRLWQVSTLSMALMRAHWLPMQPAEMRACTGAIYERANVFTANSLFRRSSAPETVPESPTSEQLWTLPCSALPLAVTRPIRTGCVHPLLFGLHLSYFYCQPQQRNTQSHGRATDLRRYVPFFAFLLYILN